MTKTLMAKALKDPEALKRELWGWYIYDFANSAFGNSAGGVRAPSTPPFPYNAIPTTTSAHTQVCNFPPLTCTDVHPAPR